MTQDALPDVNFRLRRNERITKRTDFDIIFRKGSRYSTHYFTIILHENKRDVQRLGMAVSRKVGGAVKRNRVKRLLREYFRLNKDRLPQGYDIVFIAKSESTTLHYFTLTEDLSKFFGRLTAV